jgi:SAM-dependent methyltransferase
MEKLELLLEEILNDKLEEIIISNSRNQEVVKKIKIRPVLIKEEPYFQESRYVGTKIFHKNFYKEEMKKEVFRIMEKECKQFEAETSTETCTLLVSKKNKMTIKRKKKSGGDVCQIKDLSHNRQKKYILDQKKPLGFLIDLGVQTKDGNIVKGKYDKFRQMNRYLEFVEDILPRLQEIKKEKLTIIDFGCGKSYLTFALYYYLHEMQGLQVKLIGLDLKEDVINHCSNLAEKYKYTDLHFIQGDIAKFEGEHEVDMVVTLHACDIATDFALAKAMGWNAKIIFSVPCCQHEINRQIKAEEWEPIFKYGLLKERIAALITDGLRANIMEEQGYATQVMEFIDINNTPKNILIRGIKKDNYKIKEDYKKLIEKLSLKPTLFELMNS